MQYQHARNLHKYANEKYALYVQNKPKICMKLHFYEDICVICLNMYKEKFAIICKLNVHKCARNLQQYMQYQVCKHMCIISSNMQKYTKQNTHIYTNIPYAQIMHKLCTNYAQIRTNMHFQYMHKYMFYMHKYMHYMLEYA